MKKNVLKKLSALLLCGAIVIGCMTGCGNEAQKTSESKKEESTPVSSSQSGSTVVEEVPQEPVKLTMWSSWTCQNQVDDPGDTAFYQAIEKACNVEFEFVDSTGGKEAMSVLIGTNTLPDLVFAYRTEIAGGVESLLDQELIVALDEFIEQGWMPNFVAQLEMDPARAKLAQVKDGRYAAAGKFISDDGADFSEGYIIRQDWLNELGLEVPKTIDEMETVLLAFKEKYGAIGIAFSNNGNNNISNAFGVYESYYLEDGVIKYGYYEDAYKDYLTLVNKWIEMGIYDPDTFTQDENTFYSKMTTGKYGLVYGFRGGTLGKVATFENGLSEAWVPIAFPTLVEGEDYPVDKRWGNYDTTKQLFVSENCDDDKREAAAKVIDFLFSEEGYELITWGIEGESYEVVNGEKKYTEQVLNNPNGFAFTEALSYYTGEVANIVGVWTIDAVNRSLQYDSQVLANELWNISTGPIKITGLGSMSAEEKEEYNLYATDISTYAKEGAMRFMLGSEPLENFDEYQKELEKLNIKRVLEIRQSAYDRYIGK